MGWYRDIRSVLNQEPETWLAYLHGQKLEELPHISNSSSRIKGSFLLLIKHLYFVIRSVTFRRGSPKRKAYDVFLYSGTYNQISSLHGVSLALEARGGEVFRVGSSKLLNNLDADFRNGYIPFRLTLFDALKSLVFLVSNGPKLYAILVKEKGERRRRLLFLNEFLNVYPFLVYFHRVLKESSPSIVLVSNDHSTANRCLLAIGSFLGIKTAYLQHASVSHVFPALRVDYAFLDGQCAADIYAECVTNKSAGELTQVEPKVYLTGQHKSLERSQEHPSVIGVAINLLDKPDDVMSFIERLSESGRPVCLRWHPRQSQDDVDLFYQRFLGSGSVFLSDPDKEPVAGFMKRIGWLVAGNSSIHLEAALSGVLPIHFELSQVSVTDYYGYVRNGLARHADTVTEIISLVEASQDCHEPNPEAVRYYSASYLTEWEGREGDRVADLLLSLVRSKQ